MISDVDMYLFGQGTHYEIYKKLGAHPCEVGGVAGFSFAVWAPHAVSVSVVGDFNGWNNTRNPMMLLEGSGIFACFIPEAQAGQLYKYDILTQNHQHLLKADPFAFSTEFRPGTASRLYAPSYEFHDDEWIAARPASQAEIRRAPLAIYECQLASWMRHPGADPSFYSYRKLAERLGGYVKYMGYTHVELIGISEYPLDASWGYQVTGYYSPTSRHGSPDDFKYFVDEMHKQGIGVIMDWVPAHFPRDAHALANFDGEPLFEYADPRRGEHAEWGTKVFDLGRPQVSNFLIANALYWLREFHIDGLRVDAVASMLYLDYGKQGGNCATNIYGGNENLESIEFFKHLNSVIRRECPGTFTVAEESTAWPGVTADPEDGGLGFTFKWNMGWMHDFLEYMEKDPIFRRYHHGKMTLPMTYSGAEHYILVLSHDEVVHMKRSMFEKMPGDEWQKYAGLKAAYTFMTGHPGKKLLFMGGEFGQRREWNEDRELDWFMLGDERNRDLQAYYRSLLELYRRYPILYTTDFGGEGFEWINSWDADRCIFSFTRGDSKKEHPLVFVVNFAPVPRDDYAVGAPAEGRYELLLDQTHGFYEDAEDRPVLETEASECDGRPNRLSFPLAAYGTAVYRKL
ncbi:MAG: 1,4-alpha-glucan branching protein GlgB [Lachnospiraceae bacterium]|nr:1,4-alpha-glucan branching protein GlgB [Lachnospiraceae bacterium]